MNLSLPLVYEARGDRHPARNKRHDQQRGLCRDSRQGPQGAQQSRGVTERGE